MQPLPAHSHASEQAPAVGFCSHQPKGSNALQLLKFALGLRRSHHRLRTTGRKDFWHDLQQTDVLLELSACRFILQHGDLSGDVKDTECFEAISVGLKLTVPTGASVLRATCQHDVSREQGHCVCLRSLFGSLNSLCKLGALCLGLQQILELT